MTVAAVTERDGRFLLVEERSQGRLVLNQPAGHLEDNESLFDAVVRETLEETTWHFQPQAVVGLYRWRQPSRGKTYMRVSFSGPVNGRDETRALDADIERALWMSLDEIRQCEGRLRSPLVLRAIEDYIAGCAWPLSMISDVE